ncbi:MAG TPA: hypothetical protein PLN96_04725 [Zoogloea sp.]|uniref:hypothetical protein n=1 Tax=Zoogloea sp. TaxID=49181 RepID=UPI002BF49D8D|nr:hypothetical protein [Zoogloea sp.]HMV18474.1 hypothetical protein [Rhodocyclaceae bacterium]HMV62375.1 hypothetical protein [Rhodocyclaceae bacterium]HMW50994.1 hypothetical protein [Rhodocyclaceae bacterium]HMY49116.1 hypothetical protein [Rhodocyclaceae bacterium]HMZ75643.1 hypothetical protein [Rhodocyclaceae bacterium]
MCSINGYKKSQPAGWLFSLPEEGLLLVGSRSGGSSFSGLGVSSRGSGSGRGSGFSRLGVSSRGSRGRSSSGSRSSGRSRRFNGLGFFLLAASGNGQGDESSNEERLFHCWFPLSISEFNGLKIRSNQVGDPI